MADFDFMYGPAETVAPQLLGCSLLRVLDGRTIKARIVEVEAYDQTDAASHSYQGRTPRTDIMFGPAGHLYVYFTYGMHYCMNIVTGPPGHGSAVLIRALEPLIGGDIMQTNRGGRPDIANGPAKACQALQIDKSWNGHDLSQPPLQLIIEDPLPQDTIVQTTRIGISQAKDVPWRFYIAGNGHVSKTV